MTCGLKDARGGALELEATGCWTCGCETSLGTLSVVESSSSVRCVVAGAFDAVESRLSISICELPAILLQACVLYLCVVHRKWRGVKRHKQELVEHMNLSELRNSNDALTNNNYKQQLVLLYCICIRY